MGQVQCQDRAPNKFQLVIVASGLRQLQKIPSNIRSGGKVSVCQAVWHAIRPYLNLTEIKQQQIFRKDGTIYLTLTPHLEKRLLKRGFKYAPLRIQSWRLRDALISAVGAIGLGTAAYYYHKVPKKPLKPLTPPKPDKPPDPQKAPKPEKAPEPQKAPKPEMAPEPQKAPKPEKAPEPEKAPVASPPPGPPGAPGASGPSTSSSLGKSLAMIDNIIAKLRPQKRKRRKKKKRSQKIKKAKEGSEAEGCPQLVAVWDREKRFQQFLQPDIKIPATVDACLADGKVTNTLGKMPPRLETFLVTLRLNLKQNLSGKKPKVVEWNAKVIEGLVKAIDPKSPPPLLGESTVYSWDIHTTFQKSEYWDPTVNFLETWRSIVPRELLMTSGSLRVFSNLDYYLFQDLLPGVTRETIERKVKGLKILGKAADTHKMLHAQLIKERQAKYSGDLVSLYLDKYMAFLSQFKDEHKDKLANCQMLWEAMRKIPKVQTPLQCKFFNLPGLDSQLSCTLAGWMVCNFQNKLQPLPVNINFYPLCPKKRERQYYTQMGKDLRDISQGNDIKDFKKFETLLASCGCVDVARFFVQDERDLQDKGIIDGLKENIKAKEFQDSIKMGAWHLSCSDLKVPPWPKHPSSPPRPGTH